MRVVTNIPITIGKGLTGITWGKEITEDQKQFTKKLFENTSKIYEFTEDYLDIFLALTSSGPAIIALIIEALSDGGLSGGLPKIISEELVMEMILGTICLIKENKLIQKFPNHKCVRVVTNIPITIGKGLTAVSYTHLRAHET